MKRFLLLPLCALCLATGAYAQEAQSLKDAYKDYFMIGVAVNQRNISDSLQSALVTPGHGSAPTASPTSAARTASSCAATR